MRVAILGGQDYKEAELEDWLYKLHDKYPDAVIVTRGERGAEKQVKTLMEAIGHTVESPPRKDWAKAPSDLMGMECITGVIQLYKDEKGKTQSRFITPPADVIVVVGNPNSAAGKIASDIYKRLDAWREPQNRRPFTVVAAPAAQKKKPPPRKPTKKRETLAA